MQADSLFPSRCSSWSSEPSFRDTEKALARVAVEWAGGRVIHLSGPFFSLRNVCDLTSLSDPWALCLLPQVRVGAMQFSSAPRLEFPLDTLSSQQEVKAKIKRMVFKYVC